MSTAKDAKSGHPKHSPDHPGRAGDSEHAEAPTEAPTEARMPGERQTEGGWNSVSRRVLLAGTAAFAVGASARSVAAAAGGGHEHHDHAGSGDHALIRAAGDCAVAGEICDAHCQALLASGDTSLADCSAAVREMMAGCTALTKLAALGSKRLPEMAKLCSSILEACKLECEKHDHHEECTACAKACDGCLAECKKVMA